MGPTLTVRDPLVTAFSGGRANRAIPDAGRA